VCRVCVCLSFCACLYDEWVWIFFLNNTRDFMLSYNCCTFEMINIRNVLQLAARF